MTTSELDAIFGELFSQLGLEISSAVEQDDEVFLVNLEGRDARWFDTIGREGRAGALVTLVKLVSEKRHGVDPRIIIDVHHKRQQRLDNVVQLAKKKAEFVRIRGEEEEMPPMTPAERRAVHKALEEMPGVKTVSRGEEPHRRIVIIIDED